MAVRQEAQQRGHVSQQRGTHGRRSRHDGSRRVYIGCCSSMNTLINQLSDNVSNTYTAAGDGVGGAGKYHVDASGVRSSVSATEER